jgi:hypothetical protein
VEEQIVVTGEEVPSAYGAPPGFSRGRFSPTTTAYVLPPGGVYAGIIYEGDAFRHGPPDHLFTEEVEVGLPYRLGLAFEIEQETSMAISRTRVSASKRATRSPIGTRFH